MAQCHRKLCFNQRFRKRQNNNTGGPAPHLFLTVFGLYPGGVSAPKTARIFSGSGRATTPRSLTSAAGVISKAGFSAVTPVGASGPPGHGGKGFGVRGFRFHVLTVSFIMAIKVRVNISSCKSIPLFMPNGLYR